MRESSLILLSKGKDPKRVENWRPIALLNTDRKLLARIFFTRLSSFSGTLLSPVQFCTVKGRSIFGVILTIKEALELCKVQNTGCYFLSLDQAKAFDRVDQEYLWAILAKRLQASGIEGLSVPCCQPLRSVAYADDVTVAVSCPEDARISYGATDPVLNDRTLYPYHFSTGLNDDILHIAIAELVEHLGWTWVIILALGDEHGESKNLRNEINKHGACVDFIGTLTEDTNTNIRTLERIQKSTAQLHRYLRNVRFTEPCGTEINVNEINKSPVKFTIDTWLITYAISQRIQVGEYFWSGSESSLKIDIQKIFWKKETNNQFLKSQCSPNCPPGYRKVPRERAPPCCYDCARCSEGEISNLTDMENCLKCPIYEWPNNEKTMCIEKQTEFLSFEADSLTLVFIVLSVVSLLLVTVIIGIFISFRDTPLVKANNRNLSFILLFSIKLSFLSVFLFLGRPSDITCILRQTSFGISFSIAMSSVLAKTIMVCIAFKASKPNSPWRKWLGVKITYFIVIICSFIQFLISAIWLIISPPFMELNILSEPGKIIVQCNEGSVIAFYIVLSYMGLLASVSFIVAFLARTLPDSFNEAKYITFSMLLFCSVWITMIPAYLSTKGKYMVAVEIFAIISSSCGLLFCIFLPKCYIIIFKPNRNTKQYLLGNNK
ncbi:vomeronasal type-2 receptor 26-like [Xenopus laevis]|uniref:Vomeronasal type-2 receptor 26-like n=1 Tax=Xenopus laevis TaxID=8355 RepID=A0A8J1MC95_XENLA|nr:vomeronasal type-2 receptor 26-like [Xenopus laevis]